LACDDDPCAGVTPPGSGFASIISGLAVSNSSTYLIRVASYGASPTGGVGTLGHAAAEIPSGKYVSSVTIVNPGTIRIAYSNAGGFQANANLNGLVLDLRPALSGAAATAFLREKIERNRIRCFRCAD